ncbi:hypothetical protein [Lysobacter auxotrophicus]|uniref:Secreted protein n=1 Tax=Lysobacter auxotrophicus TaxID=2992573 RepID=A0ABM8DAN4_9GAMM|nr:hypothetical protein [Lysobacter auxotrophicus]BDU15623.1 hypothetical protein LA521A_08240 [Lysobacter auxotrophicus]
MRRSVLFAIAVLLSLPASAGERTWVPVEQRLTAEQLRATGLDTLSGEQLALLNRLLSEDRAEDLRAAQAQRTQDEAGMRPKRTPAQTVKAIVPGSSRAWAQGQTLLLDNGQRWRVMDSGVNFTRPVTDARVTIAPGMLGAWYLRMDDGTPPIKVQRVD